jgi:hypothetical protein
MAILDKRLINLQVNEKYIFYVRDRMGKKYCHLFVYPTPINRRLLYACEREQGRLYCYLFLSVNLRYEANDNSSIGTRKSHNSSFTCPLLISCTSNGSHALK